MKLLSSKISEMIFGADDEINVRKARMRAGRLGVTRQEFRPFRQELEEMGIVKTFGSGRSLALKRVLP